MSCRVERYDHPMIVVRDLRTGARHEFKVGYDGVLVRDAAWFDPSEARRTAIAFLDRYLGHVRDGVRRMLAAGDVAGLSALQANP